MATAARRAFIEGAETARGLEGDLKLARCWLNTASSDLRRKDRIDALDSVELAIKKLQSARTRLRASVQLIMGGR